MKNNTHKQAIGIFRHNLLPPSEIFIAEQTKHITEFEVHYFGREKGLGNFNLPNCHLIQENPLTRSPEQIWYTLTGRSKKMIEMMISVKPLLLHAHFGVEGVYALPYARRLGIPLVTTFHGFDATRTTKALIKSGKPAWFRYARNVDSLAQNGDLFIAVSDHIRTKLLERNFPPDRTIVHHIGIDTDLINTSGCIDDGRTVLTIGRLVEKKGTEFLIRAFAKVLNSLPMAKLEIIGDGPKRLFLEKLASELGISDRVLFRGTCTRDEVIETLKRASVFCLPSVIASDGDAEGLPTVLLEASACMKPIVATWHSGIPSAVIDSVNGFLVPEKNVDALAGQLAFLLNSPELRNKMGLAGRKLVETQFNLRNQTKKLEQIYSNLIEQSSIE